jgi:hypothetical protein
MVEISLTQNKIATVDDEDADLVERTWCAVNINSNTYAMSGAGDRPYLHQVIAQRMGIQGLVDHKDRNGLNCRRDNLRPATRDQNNQNQRRRKDNTSGIKGVSWDKRYQKWDVRIMVNKKSKFIGRFTDLEEAKKQIEAARKRLHGEFACHG